MQRNNLRQTGTVAHGSVNHELGPFSCPLARHLWRSARAWRRVSDRLPADLAPQSQLDHVMKGSDSAVRGMCSENSSLPIAFIYAGFTAGGQTPDYDDL